MSDQYWNFNYAISPVFNEKGLSELGCDYVPLGLSFEKGQKTKYHIYRDDHSFLSGVAK